VTSDGAGRSLPKPDPRALLGAPIRMDGVATPPTFEGGPHSSFSTLSEPVALRLFSDRDYCQSEVEGVLPPLPPVLRLQAVHARCNFRRLWGLTHILRKLHVKWAARGWKREESGEEAVPIFGCW
jgi:hypothetical protein